MRIHALLLPAALAALLACSPRSAEPPPNDEPAGDPVFHEGFETGTTEAWNGEPAEGEEWNRALDDDAPVEAPPLPAEPVPEPPPA
jgi:hypothetical protein